MKKTLYLSIIILATFISCSKDTPEVPKKELNTSIEYKIKLENAKYAIQEVKITGTPVIVDWGDGSEKTIVEDKGATHVSILKHTYAKLNKEYTITIGAENITGFELPQNLSPANGAKDLRFGSCPKLKTVERIHYASIEDKVLDLSRCPALEKLEILSGNFTHLKLADNSNLKRITISGDIEELNLVKHPKLESIRIYAKSLHTLRMPENGIVKELLLLKYTSYETPTPLTLELNNCTKIEQLVIENHSIGTLNTGSMPQLTFLGCINAGLKTLDVSKNTKLVNLDCKQNELVKLDLSNNDQLKWLDCVSNKLEAITLADNNALYEIYAMWNKLDSEAMNSLFAKLKNADTNEYPVGYFLGNPGANGCDATIAESKGWQIFKTAPPLR